MPQYDLSIRFWGVRGSFPVPGGQTVRYGGNTACIEVRTPKHLLILDAGTGIIPLGDKILEEFHNSNPGAEDQLQITVLLTHTHHDHIQGLPFFQPAHQGYCSLHIFGPQLLGEDLAQSLSISMEPRYCPIRLEEMNSEKIIVNMSESDMLILKNSGQAPYLQKNHKNHAPPAVDSQDLLVTAYHSYAHPKDGVLVFRVTSNGKSIVYATDTEGYTGGDSRLIRFAQGADVLIHDAQYISEEYTDPAHPKQGYGHSTVGMACEVAEKARVGRLVLFHHDPLHDDDEMDKIETYAKSLFPNTVAGREGMKICI
ncbi:MAG: MBL fold metallo-hydrolase [Calditrichaeota bacterium]|nr:MAG: MBL fold metallo-hydrolase [Calditrichota bacterium]